MKAKSLSMMVLLIVGLLFCSCESVKMEESSSLTPETKETEANTETDTEASIETNTETDTETNAETNTETNTETSTGAEMPGTDSFTENPEALEQAAKSVVKLEAFDRNGNRITTGSGFAAIEEGILITASHVIVNMDHMTATTDDGETFTVGKVIEADREKDVVICLLPEEIRLPLLPVESAMPLRGEKTAVIGSQFGILNLVTLGNYCGSWEASGISWFLFSAPVSGGSSGGPVFNDRGKVIGVVTGTYENGQNLNIATPVSLVLDMYENYSEDAEK